MLQWNELRLTPDGKYLVMDVQVQELDYFKDVYIDNIQLNVYNTPESFITPVPDSNSIMIWEDTSSKNLRRVREFIDIDTIQDKLFFVYATAKGTAGSDTPCGAKNPLLVGIVYNKALLHTNSVKVLRTLDECVPSKELIDYILMLKAFELSISLGDYKAAISYWNKKTTKGHTFTTNCGCDGNQ